MLSVSKHLREQTPPHTLEILAVRANKRQKPSAALLAVLHAHAIALELVLEKCSG